MIARPEHDGAITALLPQVIARIFRSVGRVAAKTAIIIACCSSSDAASELPPLSLDELVGITAGHDPERIKAVHLMPYEKERIAILRLAEWPAVSPEEEAKIVATLGALLLGSNQHFHPSAAYALGRRRRGEFTSYLLAATDKSLHLFRAFLRGWAKTERSAEMFYLGLRSDIPLVRYQALDLINDSKAPVEQVALWREELERILETDPSLGVRREAAKVLRRIGDSKSLPILQKTIQKDPQNNEAFDAIALLGSDAQVPTLLALVDRGDAQARQHAVRALAQIKVKKVKPLRDGLVRALERDGERPSLVAAAALARYKDPRALPYLRRIAESPPDRYSSERTCVRAIAEIGGPEARALLHELVSNRWCARAGVEDELVKFAHPTSGPVVWAVYLRHPARRSVSGGCLLTTGYTEGLKVLRVCADDELLEKIRARAAEIEDKTEKRILTRLVTAIEQRLPWPIY